MGLLKEITGADQSQHVYVSISSIYLFLMSVAIASEQQGVRKLVHQAACSYRGERVVRYVYSIQMICTTCRTAVNNLCKSAALQ
jgi:hypothetical protein